MENMMEEKSLGLSDRLGFSACGLIVLAMCLMALKYIKTEMFQLKMLQVFCFSCMLLMAIAAMTTVICLLIPPLGRRFTSSTLWKWVEQRLNPAQG